MELSFSQLVNPSPHSDLRLKGLWICCHYHTVYQSFVTFITAAILHSVVIISPTRLCIPWGWELGLVLLAALSPGPSRVWPTAVDQKPFTEWVNASPGPLAWSCGVSAGPSSPPYSCLLWNKGPRTSRSSSRQCGAMGTLWVLKSAARVWVLVLPCIPLWPWVSDKTVSLSIKKRERETLRSSS